MFFFKVKFILSYVFNIFYYNFFLLMFMDNILEFFGCFFNYLVLYIELFGEVGYLGV